METTHHLIHFRDARQLAPVADDSVDLVLTSPPYPMVRMWDDLFARQDPDILADIEALRGQEAFEGMHRILDAVWHECIRVLKPGALACINVGDAVRTLDNRFGLYPNHARILTALTSAGLTALPLILWRKQTNAPNKFMGSGMLPAGAYVTLEHEYILIFRKGPKRAFPTDQEREIRRQSALFWEERNLWFSDIWTDLKGTGQELASTTTRKRSGAFPFELAYRLIQMFSVKGDTVMDPFAGTGTTLFAAMSSGRHSIGFEVEPGLHASIVSGIGRTKTTANQRIAQRLADHMAFVEARFLNRSDAAYFNHHYGFPVVTGQETDLLFNPVRRIRKNGGTSFEVEYLSEPILNPERYEQPSLFDNIR
ncbi:MAG: site-specific DNA-methyltransferase [Desulfobacterales bacterium]|jgi:DNA modification methylase